MFARHSRPFWAPTFCALLLCCMFGAGAAPARAATITATIPAFGLNDLRSDGILQADQAWNGPADLDMMAATGVRLYRLRATARAAPSGRPVVVWLAR